MAEDVVRYHAKSALVSKAVWLGVAAAVVGVLADPEVLAVLPLSWVPRILAVTGVLVVIVRYFTVRPVAPILPGETAVVQVEKL